MSDQPYQVTLYPDNIADEELTESELDISGLNFRMGFTRTRKMTELA